MESLEGLSSEEIFNNISSESKAPNTRRQYASYKRKFDEYLEEKLPDQPLNAVNILKTYISNNNNNNNNSSNNNNNI